jgi:hypothetical protein
MTLGLGILFLSFVEMSALRALGWVLAAFGALLVAGVAMQLRQPRVGFANGKVLFFLRARRPVDAPVEAVEAFFVGQGPAHLPAAVGRDANCLNLVARISQRFPELACVDVKPALGSWRDGYATIRGAWCEPINQELVRKINHRLREMHDLKKHDLMKSEE